MEYIILRNGLRMPMIGLGTWGPQFSLPSLTPDQEELVANAIETAVVEVGYLHIDTAYIYGTEKVIGRTLKNLIDDGIVRRENIFITTKLPGIGMTPEKVGYFLEMQLKNLQLDYVDLYLIHSPIGIKYHDDETFWPMNSNGEVNLDLKTDLVAVWKAMEAEVDAGRVNTIGISNFRESQILRIVENARILPSNLQIELSVFLQQNDLRKICKEYGITVSAYSPLGSPGAVNQLKAIGAEDKKVDILNDTVIAQISAKHNKTPAQIALKFLIQQGVAVLPKSFTAARLHENFQIFDFTLDAKDMESLKTLDRGENGRVFQWKAFLNYRDHPECPN